MLVKIRVIDEFGRVQFETDKAREDDGDRMMRKAIRAGHQITVSHAKFEMKTPTEPLATPKNSIGEEVAEAIAEMA